MKRTLRPQEKRKSTEMDDFLYYGASASKLTKGNNNEQHRRVGKVENKKTENEKLKEMNNILETQIKKYKMEKEIEGKEREKLENELREINKNVVAELAQCKIEMEKYKREYEEFEEIKKNSEAELAQCKIEMEKYKGECEVFEEIKKNFEAELTKYKLQGECSVQSSPSLENTNEENPTYDEVLFTWKKISSPTEFKHVDLEMKRDTEKDSKLVEYINSNNFEDTVESFIQKSAQLLFRKQFFIDSVRFKNGRNCSCMKDTKILKCLKNSIRSQSRFDEELKKIEDLDDLIRETFYAYKPKIKLNPDLWTEE